MIIDCHIHLNRYGENMSTSVHERLHVLENCMKKNRIDMGIILSSSIVNEDRPSTDEIISLVANKPYFKVIAGISYAMMEKKDFGALRQHLKDKAVIGLKLYPGYEPYFPFDPKTHSVYELAEQFDVPVMIHCGDTYSEQGRIKYAHPIHIDEIAVDFRKVKFVICHLGYPWFEDTMEVIYKNSNVYTDISGLTLGNFTKRFEDYLAKKFQEIFVFGVDPTRVLFGTDWPLASFESYLLFIEHLKVPKDEKELFLWHNSAELFKLSATQSLFSSLI